jgi:hypothetical protein
MKPEVRDQHKDRGEHERNEHPTSNIEPSKPFKDRKKMDDRFARTRDDKDSL